MAVQKRHPRPRPPRQSTLKCRRRAPGHLKTATECQMETVWPFFTPSTAVPRASTKPPTTPRQACQGQTHHTPARFKQGCAPWRGRVVVWVVVFASQPSQVGTRKSPCPSPGCGAAATQSQPPPHTRLKSCTPGAWHGGVEIRPAAISQGGRGPQAWRARACRVCANAQHVRLPRRLRQPVPLRAAPTAEELVSRTGSW